MSYKNLKNFQVIFNRNDFNYVSDHKKIEEIGEIILYHISNPDGRESDYAKLLQEFLGNLGSFYKSISGHNIPDIMRGYLIIYRELQKCVNLFSEQEFKRKSISGGYCRKFNKIFLAGLILIDAGLSDLFKINGGIILGDEYFANYLMNVTVGLGDNYKFSQSVINKIKNHYFGQKALQQFFLNLKKRHKVRDIGRGWEKYGSGTGNDYRAYGAKKRLFHKTRIYFLIPNTPALKRRTDDYVRINESKDVAFREAA